jgi:hypothetical protein
MMFANKNMLIGIKHDVTNERYEAANQIVWS